VLSEYDTRGSNQPSFSFWLFTIQLFGYLAYNTHMTEEFIKRNAHKHEHGEKLEKELMQRMEESKMFRKSVDLAMIFLILAFAAYVVV
jgi:hypothetical protein